MTGREAMDELKRLADEVCMLILHTDLPAVDIEIRIDQVRQRCEELFPDRLDLFEMVYASRFRRLMQQWHTERSDEAYWSQTARWSPHEEDEEGELV